MAVSLYVEREPQLLVGLYFAGRPDFASFRQLLALSRASCLCKLDDQAKSQIHDAGTVLPLSAGRNA